MKHLERTKNTIRNFIGGLINKGATLLLPFLMRYVIVIYLGKEYLGLNNLFASVLSVLNLAELGIGAALVYSMYKPIAKDDRKAICSLLSLYKKIYRIIGLIVLVVGLAIIPFLPFLIKDNVEVIDIKLLYLFFLADTVLSYLLFAYKNSLLMAHQRTDVSSNIGTIVNIALNVTQLVLLIAFRNYYVFIMVKPAFTVINNLVINWATNKMYPDYKPNGIVAKQQRKEIMERVKALAGHKIGATVVTSADSFVISAFLGLDVLAIYSNYYYIAFFIISITAMFFSGMLAGIGNSLVTESQEKNYQLFKNVNFILSWIVSWCSVCLLCLFQPFMEAWMGEDMLLSNSSLLLIVLYYYSWQFRTTGLYFKDAAGLWQADFWKPYVSSLINIVLNIVLVNIIGINGVFISTIICMAVVNYPWETRVIFRDLFKRSSREYYLSELQNFVKAIVMCAVTFSLCMLLPVQHGIWCICFRFAICLIIPNLIFVLCSFKLKEFSYSIDKAKRLLTRKT